VAESSNGESDSLSHRELTPAPLLTESTLVAVSRIPND